MIVELGLYKANRTMMLNRYPLAYGQIVDVNQLILNRDIAECCATVVISRSEQIRVPIEAFIRNFTKLKDKDNEVEPQKISIR